MESVRIAIEFVAYVLDVSCYLLCVGTVAAIGIVG